MRSHELIQFRKQCGIALSWMTGQVLSKGFSLNKNESTRSWQGQGLMSEASAPATNCWFDVLTFPILRAPKSVAKAPSRISEKQGLRLVAQVEHGFVVVRLPTEMSEIRVTAWHTSR